MKGIIILVLLVAQAVLPPPVAAGVEADAANRPDRFDPASDESWRLIWSDEFDGTRIDTRKWEVVTGGPWDLGSGWPRGYRRAENVYLDGKGHAVIRFSRDGKGDLTVGAVKSRREFLYGYFEARLKLTTQPGWWAAFWLYRARNGANPFLHGLEIDIVEDFPKKSRNMNAVQEAVHAGVPSAYAKSFTNIAEIEDWSAFHVFGLKWTPLEYTFYIDGVEVLRWGKEEAVTTRPCRVWLSSNTGSLDRAGFTGDYRDAALPDYFVIDYVRVYERVGGKAPVVSITSPAGDGPMSVKAGTGVTIEASAEDPDGSVRKVYLFDNGYLLDAKTARPYRFDVTFNEAYYSKTAYMRPADLRGVSTLLTEHVFVVMAEDDEGRVGASAPVVFYVESPVPSRPYGGKPQRIPGRLELPYFDEGGQGVAYSDADAENLAAEAAKKAFRADEGVDTGGRGIGWIHDGEWLRYTVDVEAGGDYTVTVPLSAGPGSPEGVEKGVRLEVDGRHVADFMMKGVTGGWNSWTTVTRRGISLTKGRHVLTLRAVNGFFNLDYMDFRIERRSGK